MKVNILELTLTEAIKLLEEQSITHEDVLEGCYERIRKLNERLNAFITVFQENDDVKNLKRRKPLRGLPISLKDLFYTKGKETTAGSKILQGFYPPYNAYVVEKLEKAGGYIIGKTNMHEFAFGVTNRNPHYGDCRNPYDVGCISGGSSGGSAVSVATGMCLASLGTDTAGSIRIPASLCGVVGYKPTYDIISRHGVIPLSWTLDHVGFLTKSVKDAILLASITSSEGGIFNGIKAVDIRKLKIGIPKNYFLEHLQEDVRREFEKLVYELDKEGAKTKEITLENIQLLVNIRYVIVHAEAAAYHKKFIKERFSDYGDELKARLAEGLMIPATTYINAQRVRRKAVDGFRKVFKEVDLLITPTTPITAPRVVEEKVEVGDVVMDVRPALLRLTEPVNVVGAPAISLPLALSREGRPIGLQVIADVMRDRKLLSAALAFERFLKPLPRAFSA